MARCSSTRYSCRGRQETERSGPGAAVLFVREAYKHCKAVGGAARACHLRVDPHRTTTDQHGAGLLQSGRPASRMDPRGAGAADPRCEAAAATRPGASEKPGRSCYANCGITSFANQRELLEHHRLGRTMLMLMLDVLQAGEPGLRVFQISTRSPGARRNTKRLRVVLNGGHPRRPQPPRRDAASIWAGVMPGTKPSGANIFTCSS